MPGKHRRDHTRLNRRRRKNTRAGGAQCGMVRYRDHTEAAQALQHILTSGEQRASTPTRAFECPRCLGWHLTR